MSTIQCSSIAWVHSCVTLEKSLNLSEPWLLPAEVAASQDLMGKWLEGPDAELRHAQSSCCY